MSDVVILSERADDLVKSLRAVQDCGLAATAVQTTAPLRRAADSHSQAKRLVIFLTQRDNLADLRALLAVSSAMLLVVAPGATPRAALARLARQAGFGLCMREDPPALRDALIVALVTRRPERAAS
jgi:hypothetical protein